MDKLIFKRKVNFLGSLVGFCVVGLGFFFATNYVNDTLTALSPYSLMISGLIAFLLAYGPSYFLDLFSTPSDPKGNVKNFFKYLILTAVLGVASSSILIYLFNLKLAANPESGNLLSIISQLPFMLLGEELFSFYFLLVTANFVYSKTKNQKQAELIGIILSSIIFGLIHYSTYFNGNPYTTIIHVILIQGSARIAFNLSGLKAKSIWMPLLIHVVYDIIFLSLS